ncbi:vitamin K epoxide reductase family protein [Chamaesiphon sp.]|uniref:vitamin K epoxide reductase family protein n=1 Tax=Chamaesiphon sp. TaxID=2814140 RepID=UPI0035934FCE
MRKKSIPVMYRWSRPIMAGIASIGASVTAYLTYTKLTGNQAACPTGGCDVVLSSPYATVFGLPLPLFGFLAYASVIVLAIAPLLINSTEQKKLRNKLEGWTGLLLFMVATAMLVFSGYLMYLLAFEIKAVCIYCVASALFATTLFILSIVGREWQDIGQLVFNGGVVAIIFLVGTLGVYANVNKPIATAGSQGMAITTTAGTAEIELAKHLDRTGAKFYGSFLCDHCHRQKQLFGKEAVSSIPYIECTKPDKRSQTDICIEQKIQGYPHWKIGDKSFTGNQPLAKLAELSGYRGATNFKNVVAQDEH